MSKIGKISISIPEKVKAALSGNVINIEGPLGKKANYLFSYRKSFSEYYLKAFDVPVLPAYSDYQFRTKINLDAKNELIHYSHNQ